MASVTREQFKIRSELEVVHIPTGAVFSAYPYSNPDEIGTTRARVSHFMNKFRQLGFIDLAVERGSARSAADQHLNVKCAPLSM